MSVKHTLFGAVFLLALSATSCRSDYEKMVSREQARGVRCDSIFLGFSFGMSSDSFYRYCWSMNQRGIFHHGNENNRISVLYRPDTLSEPVNMYFFPDFANGRIAHMWVLFRFEAWAPWNRALYADQLVAEVRHRAERWYGTGFLEQRTPAGKPFWVKVEGNRQILVSQFNDRCVQMNVTDLSVPEEQWKPKPTPTAAR